MNLICNNCVGARLYEFTKQQFPNPFMWNAINRFDFIKFINEYDSIDFENPVFELETYLNNTYESVLVTLNIGVKVHYIHYIQDLTKKIPVKEKSTNILYCDILSYAKEKWYKRIHRSNEYPTFMFSFNYMKTTDPDYIKIMDELLKVKKQLIILAHESIEKIKNIPYNIKIIYLDDEKMAGNGKIARDIHNLVFC